MSTSALSSALVKQEGGGEEPPSRRSGETLLKAQGVALTLRQPGYPHSEGRLNLPSFGHSPTQAVPRPPSRSSPQPAGPQGSGQPARPHVQRPWPSSLGREDGASESPLGSREKGIVPIYSLPWRACRLESPKMVFTTQLAAINYSRPCFPQTHRLSLLAR